MKKREFLLRIFIGLGCLAAFTPLVLWRQHVVQTQRDQTIVSTISEWKTHGKPVIAQNIARQDMKVYEKISITSVSKTLFEGYVTRDIQEQLKAGQTVYLDAKGGERVFGVISYVGQALDMDTGMFRVRAAFDREATLSNHIIVVYVHTGTIKDVISIPTEIVERVNGNFFVWEIQDGHAYKKGIVLGAENSYGAVVLQGLHDGDIVVIQGQTQLSHGDKIRVVDNREVARHMP